MDSLSKGEPETFGALSSEGWQVRRAVGLLKHEFEARVAAGDKEGAEELYVAVYELREWMNRVHAGTVWRREVS